MKKCNCTENCQDARRDERAKIIKMIEMEIKVFRSDGYATNQPHSSHSERFACGRIIDAIEGMNDDLE